MSTTFDNDVHVRGRLIASSFTPPASSIGNTAVQTGSPIDAEKLEHQYPIRSNLFAPGTTVTAVTELIHIARAAGSVQAIEAVTTTVATGADRTVTIDLQKSTAGGAFATVLSSTIVLDNTSVVRVAEAGVVDTSGDYIDGDVFQVVVTVAGAAGNQAAGLLVTTTFREQPV